MATRRKRSKLGRLNVFANSPRFVKLFGPLIILLMVGAIGYGGYTIISQRLSDAASQKLTWHYNSRGIKHDYGFVSDAGRYGSTGKLWAVLSGDQKQTNKSEPFAWRGPGVKLPKSQYLGCFYYRLVNVRHNSSGEVNKSWTETAKAELQIYNHTNKKVQHRYTDTGVTASASTLKKWKLRRTCLAFYIGKKNADFSLRVKLKSGNMYIKRTKISRVPSSDNKLNNIYLLIPKDNISWIIGGRYR